ncbi:hypothetical protein D9757_007244 [Collybiopsis confluens]|uniref:Pseudouridine synthase RsuA/RluA-like domain-containing protein n=1 Tax=Collybiopsis confluens TaxID=2823264 RepID=A0A8H5HAQ3_9AGAR|nr:hypothetical protein D9757_007244 [Collybiopsis confluens]
MIVNQTSRPGGTRVTGDHEGVSFLSFILPLASPAFSNIIGRVQVVRPPSLIQIQDQFRHTIACMIMSSFGGGVTEQSESVYLETVPGLKKIPPYWYPYTTYAKERWLGRELLEVVSTEFRDRSIEYYRYALESGVTTINGQVAKPDHIIQNGDRMENVVHRHEPPVSSIPIKVLLEDNEREFIVVDKPGSIPVHALGRYHCNTLVAILMSNFGYEKIYTINCLERLTSGLMILQTSSNRARRLTNEFVLGAVRTEYVAQVNGKFPGNEITCKEPLLTVDRQMGLNIVHPDGKPARTVFQRLRFLTSIVEHN